MPVLINSVNFTDEFGNTTGFYKSNAGDKITAVIKTECSIRLTTQGNPMQLDGSLNQVTSPTSWIDEGFRVGDWVYIRLHSSGGAVINWWWSQITYVDHVLCDFTAMTTWYDITLGQFLSFEAVTASGDSNPRGRQDVDILFNHVKNTIPGSEFSLIDGETTRAIFTDVNLLTVGASQVGTMTGNQSGQFLESATIQRVANAASGFVSYEFTLIFINSGMYDAAWFQSSDCLKAFMKLAWSSLSGEPFAPTISIYNLAANTGFFNEANNSSVSNSTFIGGPSEIDYLNPTTFDIIADGPLAGLGVGSAYKSITDSYYRIQPEPQQELTIMLPTTPAVVGVYNSYTNPDGVAYTLEINSITTIGTTHTINVTITPNTQFNTFMSSRDDGDRLFYVWIKCGNINWLGFSDQLTVSPPIGGPLIMEQDYGYFDHSENVTDAIGDNTGFIADTEDDIAYMGKFLLTKGDVLQTFTARLEAFNSVTGDSFTLKNVLFSFSGVQISADGRYLLNETQNVNPELQTTSLKRNATFTLEPTLDTLTEYGVKIYAPWLLNWKYWIPKPSANVDFYPDQNENWQQYDDPANWSIRTHLELLKDGLVYTHENELIINDYDAEDYLAGTIEILQQPLNNVITFIPGNSIVYIQYTEVNLFGAWDPLRTWGQITVEPKQSAPRSYCSSVVDFDGNINNPLTPIGGPVITIFYPQPDTAVLICAFDTSKINLSNGVKITGKIKENGEPTFEGVQFQDFSLVQFVDGSFAQFQ